MSTERDLLKERLDKVLRKFFSAKSEVRGTEQKDMFFNEAEALAAAAQATPALADGDDAAVDVPGHKRLKRGRKPLDADLPRHVVRHELPEFERMCPHDGAALREIGIEASEQLDIIPQQVRVIRHERVKYACPCCDGALRLAPKPAQIIPKGLFSESALAWITTSKFDDGLPLYRQSALLARLTGADFSKNTMATSIVRVGIGVQPVINLMRDHLRSSHRFSAHHQQLLHKLPRQLAQQILNGELCLAYQRQQRQSRLRIGHQQGQCFQLRQVLINNIRLASRLLHGG